MDQSEQNQACLGYAESRQKKTEGQKIKQLYDMQLEVLKYKKVPHLEGLSSNYSELFRVVYKGSLAHAESTFRRRSKHLQI